MSALSQHPGYEEEKLQRVREQLPCRENQAGLLLSLLGQVHPHMSAQQLETFNYSIY